MPREWTSNDDRQLRELHGMGMSLGQVAKEMGRARSVVAGNAERMDVTFAPVPTTVATANALEARRARARERRLRLTEQMEADMERLWAQLFAPTTVFNFGGKDNTYEEQDIPEPTHADKLKIAQTLATAAGTLEKLERLDSATGTSEGIAMLDGIAAAIKGAADTLRGGDSGTVGDTDPDLEDLI